MFWGPVSQACQADTHWLKKLTKYSPSNVQMSFCFCFARVFCICIAFLFNVVMPSLNKISYVSYLIARMSTLKMAASYISRPVQSRFLIG